MKSRFERIAGKISDCLDSHEWGDALAHLAGPFIRRKDNDPTGLFRRFLAYSLIRPFGSLDRTEDYHEEWAYIRRHSRPTTADSVRRAIPLWSDEGFHDVLNEGLTTTTRAALAEHKRFEFYVVQLDENQIRFSGHGSKPKGQEEECRLSEAGEHATPAKDGRWHGATLAHEFIVASATLYPVEETFGVAFERRQRLRFERSDICARLLAQVRSLGTWPRWVLADKGFISHEMLAHLARFSRDSGGVTDFIVPCHRRRDAEPDKAPNDEFAMTGLAEISFAGLVKARKVPGRRNHLWYQERRRLRWAPDIDVNLVIVYRPSPTAFARKGRWRLNEEWEWFGFYCLRDYTDDTVMEAYDAYGMRWNCENLYQRMGYYMGTLPSHNLPHRTLSFGFGLLAHNLFAWKSVKRYEHRRLEEPSNSLRVKTFFDVAVRQLQEGMDPPRGSP